MLVLVLTLGLASLVLGCADDHTRRASPSWSIAPPSRPLEWGDLNVLHTTDSHGWLLGHQEPSVPEPNYSGTFGDFASFVARMKQIAEEKGVDLLLVDSGDLHDGTGLSDGYPPGGLDAHETNQFIKQLPYDVLAIGNHELYVYNNTLDMHTDFAPHWNGRYLSSNANITVPSPADPSKNVSVPVGERYAKFTTTRGRRVTSLGVLFDFTGNDEGTSVQKVEDMVKEQWFADAIADEPDLFLLVGHMPVTTRDSWPVVNAAIRAVHPDTPILIFGGHTHVRDCVQYDGRSMALESGRYMETVGWMSVKLDGDHVNSNSTGNLTFSRRYLDANRLTYEFHTNRNNHTFDTRSGLSITRGLEDLAVKFDLNFTYGVAPQDYTITRAPYPSNGSLLTLFVEQAVPIALSTNSSQNSSGMPTLYLTNSGSQRFDVFKGPFTKNDQLTSSPFLNAFVFVRNVSFVVAREVVGVLNEVGGEVRKRGLDDDEERERYGRGDVEMRYRAWLEEMYAREVRRALERRDGDVEAQEETLGYVTSDSCPGIGDDTPHIVVPFHSVPAYISSIDSFTNFTGSTTASNSSGTFPPGISSTSDAVDLVFSDFIVSDVLSILNSLQSDKVFTEDDVATYSPLLANEVLGVFAGVAWN